MGGQGMEMGLERFQRHDLVDGGAVAHHVQVVIPEVHDLAPVRILDPRLADFPFRGDDPVERARARRYFVDLQGDEAAQRGQG